jgi:copper chaperone NosL
MIMASCAKSPEPIICGSDACENCKMTISDPKFGAELITGKGKIYKFDSIECLAAYSVAIKAEEIHSGWVTNYLQPENFININNTLFLVSENLKSPMGLNISAFSEQAGIEKTKEEFGGKVLKWKDVQVYVKSEWN